MLYKYWLISNIHMIKDVTQVIQCYHYEITRFLNHIKYVREKEHSNKYRISYGLETLNRDVMEELYQQYKCKLLWDVESIYAEKYYLSHDRLAMV